VKTPVAVALKRQYLVFAGVVGHYIHSLFQRLGRIECRTNHTKCHQCKKYITNGLNHERNSFVWLQGVTQRIWRLETKYLPRWVYMCEFEKAKKLQLRIEEKGCPSLLL
jgi:hypothetical protein